MALARQRAEWDRATALMSFVAARMPLAPQWIDPDRLNPYRGTRPPRTPEQEARDDRAGWRLLEAGLRSLAGG